MPKPPSPFSNLLAFLLPVGVSTFIFVQIINNNPTFKQKFQNLYNKNLSTTSKESTKITIRATQTPSYNILAAETSTSTPTLSSLVIQTTPDVTNTSQNYTITESDKKDILSYIISNITKLTNSPNTYYSKVQLEGRTSKPALTDLLGKNYSFVWLQKDSDKLYLQSGQGGNAIQILTEKQFGRDTTFKQDLSVKQGFRVYGRSNFDKRATFKSDIIVSGASSLANTAVNGDLTVEGTTTLKDYLTAEEGSFSGNLSMGSANITGDLNLVGIFEGSSGIFSGNLSLGSANISGLLYANIGNFTGNVTMASANITGNLAGNTATFTNNVTMGSGNVVGNLAAGSVNVSGNFTGTTLTISSANLSGNLSAASGNFSGNVTMGSGNVVGNLAGNTANFTGGVTMASVNIIGNLSAATANMSGLLTGTTATFSNNVTMGSAVLTGLLSGTTINLNGLLSGTTANFTQGVSLGANTFVNGYFSAGAASLAATNISGLLSGSRALFSGDVSLGSAIINGLLSGDSASFTNNVTMGSANINGLLRGFTANFTSDVSIASLNISGNLLGTNANFTGNLSVPTATFSSNVLVLGNLTGATATFSTLSLTGNFRGTTGTFSSMFLSGNLTGATATLSALSLSGLLTGTNATLSGNFSAGTVTISSINVLGNMSVTGNISVAGINSTNLTNSATDLIIRGLGDGTYINGIVLSSPYSLGINFAQNSLGDFLFENYNYGKQAQFYVRDSDFSFWNKNISGTPSQIVKINSNGATFSNTATLAVSILKNPIATTSLPRIDVSGTLYPIATNAPSDIRLKTGIESYTNSLSVINQLNPVSFNFKNMNNMNETIPGRQIGFIAQDVEQVLPTIVGDIMERNGIVYKGIDYGRVTPLLVGAVKEQQIQISTLSNAVGAINLASLQNLYNNFNTALQNLSMSVEDGKLVVNSGFTVTGDALFNVAKFTGDVAMGQITVDTLNNAINIKASSCVDMDGNLNEANCETNKLSIMRNKAGNVDFFDGKAVVNPKGEVLGEKVQAKSFKSSDSSTPSGSTTCSPKDFKFGEDSGKAYIFYCTSDSKWVRSELSNY